jgi:hypothetical protein
LTRGRRTVLVRPAFPALAALLSPTPNPSGVHAPVPASLCMGSFQQFRSCGPISRGNERCAFLRSIVSG